MLVRTDKHQDRKIPTPFPSIGGLTTAVILGIPLCLLEGIVSHWPVWISLLSWLITTLLLALLVTPIFIVRWLRQKNLHVIVLKEETYSLPQEHTYRLGEALLLSTHLMACKKHEGLWLCCEKRAFEFVHLFVLHEEDIQYLDNHLIGSWENYLEHYGETIKGWQPAERMLPESVLQRVKSHPGR